jgi:hypothetical protein
VHDGFYLRISLGGGAQATTVEPDTDADDAVGFEISGGAVGFDLMIGGSPRPGFVVGGAIASGTSPTPELDFQGQTRELEELTTGQLGIFVDGFPDPGGGFHVGGMIALDTVRIVEANADDLEFTGAGASVWVGYDAWVSREWSLGGLIRFSGSVTHNDDVVPRQANTRGVYLLGTLLYH